ncbi:hypothetical protein N9A28_03605 [Sulfurimonas sp.]|nr:hypothetical protein [Sulfurimonas sp.]
MFKFVTSSIIVVLFTACGTKYTIPNLYETNKTSKIVKPKNYEKVQTAFKNSKLNQAKSSQWLDSTKPIELNIIGPVYKNPIEKQSIAYKKLSALIKKISKDPKLLDKLSGKNLSQYFSKINYTPYKLASDEDAKFNAVYDKRYDDKEQLVSILRQTNAAGIDKSERTLALWINPEELKENKYTLEGFKTVKTDTKERNAHYYHLTKTNSKGEDNQEIVNALLMLLQDSIPEYVSIDRADMLKDGESFRIIYDNPDATATGEVYKFTIKNELDKLKEKLDKSTDKKEVKQLQEDIKTLESSRQWRTFQTKQLMYTTPVSQETINLLKEYDYIQTAHTYNRLTVETTKEISQALNISLADPYIMTVFEQYRVLLNQLGIYVGDVSPKGKAYYLVGMDRFKNDEDRMNSENRFLMAYDLQDSTGLNDSEKVIEKKQYGQYFGLSNSGINIFDKIYQDIYSQLGKPIKIVKDLYGLHIGNKKFSYLVEDKNEISICDINKNKECQVVQLQINDTYKNLVNKTALSPDEKTIYFLGFNNQNQYIIQSYDILTNTKLLERNHSTNFTSVPIMNSATLPYYQSIFKISPNGEMISVQVSGDKTKVFDTANFKELAQLPTGIFKFSHDSKYIAISYPYKSDGFIISIHHKCEIYESRNFKLLNTYIADPKYRQKSGDLVGAMPEYFDTKNNLLFINHNKRIVSWNYEAGSTKESYTARKDIVESFAMINTISENKRYIIYLVPKSSTSLKISLFDTKHNQFVYDIDLSSVFAVDMGSKMVFIKDNHLILKLDEAIKIYDLSVLKVLGDEF